MIFKDGLFHFVGIYCPDGYELREADEIPSTDMSFLKKGTRKRGVVIEAVSKRRAPYTPSKDGANLHHVVRDLKRSPEAALEFCRRFGFLTGGMGSHASQMRIEVIYQLSQGLKDIEKLGNKFPSEEWDQLVVIREFSNVFDLESSSFKLILDPGSNGHPIFGLSPANLFSFIVLLAVSEFSGDLQWRQCANPHCGTSFRVSAGAGALSEIGVGTIRKKYCSEACKKVGKRIREKEQRNEQG